MRKRALTLIELIVVVAVITVLASTVLISFSPIESRRIDTEARTIASFLIFAREGAANRHQEYTVQLDATAKTVSIVNETGDLQKQMRVDSAIVAVDGSGSPIEDVTFAPIYGAATDSVNITLSSQGRTRNIQLYSETGYVLVQ